MLPLYKLERLPPGQRRRKLALILTECERALACDPAFADGERKPSALKEYSGAGSPVPLPSPDYLFGIVRLALLDDKLEPSEAADCARLLAELAPDSRPVSYGDGLHSVSPKDALRLCNHARHALLHAIGTFPAEWDLLGASFADVADESAGGAGAADEHAVLPSCGAGLPVRCFRSGIAVYAEDIRSPFNLGSIFRTAEAFGAERVIVSPLCVPPTHPRAIRSAMGCVDYLPWEKRSVDELPADVPVFALETGGTPIGEFDFPARGIVIIGSEELGISPEGLARATYGRVSIPMTGIKASLNVGVAFGILMQAWTSALNAT